MARIDYQLESGDCWPGSVTAVPRIDFQLAVTAVVRIDCQLAVTAVARIDCQLAVTAVARIDCQIDPEVGWPGNVTVVLE